VTLFRAGVSQVKPWLIRHCAVVVSPAGGGAVTIWRVKEERSLVPSAPRIQHHLTLGPGSGPGFPYTAVCWAPPAAGVSISAAMLLCAGQSAVDVFVYRSLSDSSPDKRWQLLVW